MFVMVMLINILFLFFNIQVILSRPSIISIRGTWLEETRWAASQEAELQTETQTKVKVTRARMGREPADPRGEKDETNRKSDRSASKTKIKKPHIL